MTTATEPQHLRALALANRTRHAQSECRRAVREAPDTAEGRRRAAALIEENPAELRNHPLDTLLREIPRQWGAVTVRMLREAGIPEHRRKLIGELTERQRGVLAGVLRGAG